MVSARKIPVRRTDASMPDARFSALGARFSGFPEVVAVYVFGSSARGTRGKRSDVDIAVLTREKGFSHRPRSLVEYVQAASDALGTDNVDVVLLDRAPIVLRHEVFREGKPLLVRDPEALSRFRQTSSREYLDTIPLRRIFEKAYFRRLRRNGFVRQAAHR
ncbi:MAG: nucleotidyltransferase domain-containing protein [Deltaproteobacteria bacterium]|nr:MAG: nucleotidyltransferase domain-containing protein [Deltaproteobacteria bacterium]